jgi:hypothetical protein
VEHRVTIELDEHALDIFKALTDEGRLKLLGALALGERGLDELATLTGRKLNALARDLERLEGLGLVETMSSATPRRFRFNAEPLRAINRALLTRPAQAVPASADEAAGVVLKNFLDGERIRDMPASRAKRNIVLAWLADRFTVGQRYTEREVNELIQRHHPDYAWLRRELVDQRFMAREHGVYWRLTHEPTT